MWKKQKNVKKYSDLYSNGFEASSKGGEIVDFTFGNVWARIWRNRDRSGKIYFRASFDRISTDGDKVRLSKSFSPEDLADLKRCILRVQHWLQENVD